MNPTSFHRRHSLRLPDYDYTQPGAYFITLVTWKRSMLFGEVREGEFEGNAYARLVDRVWGALPNHFHVELDEMVIMPNHVHGILWLLEKDGDRSDAHPTRGAVSGSLAAVVGNLKSVIAKKINGLRRSPGAPVWQRNYYEHIIRDEKALDQIRKYIRENPLRWELDEENPQRRSG